MKQKPDWIEKRQSLRKDAESMLLGVSREKPDARPAEALVHELLVHKVELEMQIEELKRSHAALEEERDRYLDLYDFAPVGYITIDRDCLIGEINLAGAAMLGLDRVKLINRSFSTFVSRQDRKRWLHLFQDMMKRAVMEKQVFVLEMMRADDAIFSAHLDCQRRESIAAQPTLRLALIDITRIRQAEAEMQASRTAVTASGTP